MPNDNVVTNDQFQIVQQELEKIKREKIELENKVVDLTAVVGETKYIDPIFDNPVWQDFVKTQKERK